MFASSSRQACSRSILNSLADKHASHKVRSLKQFVRAASTRFGTFEGQGNEAVNGSSRVLAWSAQQEHLRIKRGHTTGEYNIKMNIQLATGHHGGVVETVAEMKKLGVPPDRYTYESLLQALSKECLHAECWATLLDMEAVGIKPDVVAFDHLLIAHRYTEPENIYNILYAMKKRDVEPNAGIYNTIINYFLEGENLPVALRKLAEMSDKGFLPSMHVAQKLAETAAESGYARLALDLADAYEDSAARRLDTQYWVKLLVACAESLYVEGVERCWKRVVSELHILPDEGLCQLVLHTAARHGMPILAADAIKCLENMGVKLLEIHFAPLLESFVKNGQMKEAFRVLALMRSSSIEPTNETTYPIYSMIRKDSGDIDNAYSALEEFHNEGGVVDVSAVNVIIAASAFLRDLQRAVGVYKAMPSLNVQPNVETYNIVFTACARARHIELAERLFSEMKDAKLKPTEKTYNTFISVILTQNDYENAFFYLEEMKGKGFPVPYGLYEAIVKKCVSVGDTRYKLALEELQQAGYSVAPNLRAFINSGGQSGQNGQGGQS